MAKTTNRKFPKPRRDLTNMKFGKLTVLQVANNKSPYKWLCKCECGNIKEINGDNLYRNKTLSCGCIQKEKSSKIHSKQNTYEFKEDYVIGRDTKGNEFIFDADLFDLVSKMYWTVTRGYAKNIATNTLLHRYIINCPKDKVVDHINHNKLDNRKSNLRICTRHENSCNRRPIKRGITQIESGKYTVSITFNYKNIYLGSYDTYEDALKVRLKAEEEYFGEFQFKE